MSPTKLRLSPEVKSWHAFEWGGDCLGSVIGIRKEGEVVLVEKIKKRLVPDARSLRFEFWILSDFWSGLKVEAL